MKYRWIEEEVRQVIIERVRQAFECLSEHDYETAYRHIGFAMKLLEMENPNTTTKR